MDLNTDPEVLRVFIVRHGQTDHNVQRILQGHMDVPLNGEGERQAALLGEALANHKFDKVLTSDLQRCTHTTRVVMKANREASPVEVSPAMRERMMGEVQGMHVTAAQAKFGDSYKDQGERRTEMLARVMTQWDQFVKEGLEKGYNNVLVVTHGGVIRALVNELGGEQRVPHNTSVTIVDVTKAGAQVKMVGDVSHLETAVELGTTGTAQKKPIQTDQLAL